MDPEPKSTNPDLGLGDVFKYSGLIGEVISVVKGLSGLTTGQPQTLPPLKTWLPDGHEYEFDLTVTRKS